MKTNNDIEPIKKNETINNHRGVLAVVSGFSGAGKGTLMKELVNRYHNYALSISATTRDPRDGEMEGREYFFKTHEEFEKMIAQEEFIEYAMYVDHYYGTPREYVERHLNDGDDVILEIEMQGALTVKKKFPEAILLFIVAPSLSELKARLGKRGTESIAVIEARLKRALEEADVTDSYDYIIVNDDLEACVKEVHSIIQGEHNDLDLSREKLRNRRVIADFKAELEADILKQK
ncbi:MAG: guanylate kinase [Lachnospiraceae bacterium]|jgi:guanylate kinase|nr:guanylate kinase [Lachnospiraceae bacterium]